MQVAKGSSSKSDSSSDVSHEIEAIKDGLGQLRDDVVELFGHALGAGRSSASAAKDTATESIERVKQRFYDLKDRGADQVSEFEEMISEYPIRSALIAFGVGYLFAKLFSRR
jgi:ElaB/YqjD/DUF883 family membrane-anchored ribosome-binding protein